MTGRRAMGGWDQRLSRALQFKPGHVGGRVASAQPIQRTGGTLRRPSIGAAAVPVVAPVGRATYYTQGVQPAGVVDLQYTYWYPYPTAFTPATGDIAVTFFGAVSATPSLPSGWTSLAAGTVGVLSYVCGYRVLTGSDSWDAGVSPAYSSGWPLDGYVDVMTPLFTTPTSTPTVTVVESASATSSSAPSGSGTGLSHWWLARLSSDSTPGTATSLSSWPAAGDTAPDIIALASGGDNLSPGDATGGSVTAGASCDIAAFALSWV